MLRKDVEQDSNQEKDGELNEDDNAAGEERAAAVFFIARGEQPLDDGLVGAVAGHGEKSAADQAGPECIFCGEVKRKIEDLQFVAGGGGDLRYFSPSAGNAVEQNPKT